MILDTAHGLVVGVTEPGLEALSTIAKLVLALLAGALVGLERESHAKPAGLRTYIIICVGGCLLMLLSIHIPQITGTGDPGRIAAQVVTGIGFLGAGAIIRFGFNIKGMTSAATIWAMAAVGMAIGSGFCLGATVTVVILLVTLRLLNVVEERLLGFVIVKKITVRCASKSGIIEEVIRILDKNGIKMSDWTMQSQIEEGWLEYTAVANITGTNDILKVLDELAALDGVLEVKYE